MSKPTIPCTVCNGDSIPLGVLGRRWHYRCRRCGWTHYESETIMNNLTMEETNAED